jgi:hypothetical protein
MATKTKELTAEERKLRYPGKPLRFTPDEVVDAVRGSGGFVTEIARRLRCSRGTVYNYRRRYEEVAAAIFEEKEHLLDTAESALLRQVNNGNITAIIFYLKTQGYGRAYGDRQKLDVAGNFMAKADRNEDEEKDAAYVDKVMAELDRLQEGKGTETRS